MEDSMMKELVKLKNNIQKELDKYFTSTGILIEFNYEKEFSLLDKLIKDANKVGCWYYIYTMFYIPIPSIDKAIRIDIPFKTVERELQTYFELIDNITAKEHKFPWWSIKVTFLSYKKTEEMEKFEEKYGIRIKKKFNGVGIVFAGEIYMPLESFVEPKIVII